MATLVLRTRETLQSRLVRYYLMAVAFFLSSVPAWAQTPVPLVVPTNEIFTQTNTWMGVFAPVVAIGVGIAVALAILGFIGKEILKAFK